MECQKNPNSHDIFCKSNTCGLTIKTSALTKPKGKCLFVDPASKNEIMEYKKGNKWMMDHINHIYYSQPLKDKSRAQQMYFIDGSLNILDDATIQVDFGKHELENTISHVKFKNLGLLEYKVIIFKDGAVGFHNNG